MHNIVVKLKFLLFLLFVGFVTGCVTDNVISKDVILLDKLTTILLDKITKENFYDFKTLLESNEPKKSFSITLPEDGASFPKNFAPPEFEWESNGNDIWLIKIELPDGKKLNILTKQNYWQLSFGIWNQIKKISEDKYSTFIVYGCNGKRCSKSKQINFRISPHKIDQFVIYRIAHYPIDFANEKPDLFYRDISTSKSEIFFKAKDFCSACHVFSSDGTALVYSSRRPYKEGEGTIGGVDLVFSEGEENYSLIESEPFSYSKNNRHITGSMMASWSPDGKKVVLTINYSKSLETKFTSDRTVERFGKNGILAVYDIKRKELSLLPGAVDPPHNIFWPSFSPDGKMVSFTKQRYTNSTKGFDYDIYVIPFNDGKGGKAKPLKGASEDNIREYFQRYSPDGKWIVFNRIGGIGDAFLELSDLYIVPAEGGIPRMLECSVEGVMDSVVAWSSKGRWISFTSRRYKNEESRIYFSEIDEKGHCYPAVKMPNSEIGKKREKLAYHHAYFARNKRTLLMIKNNYNKFNKIDENK